MEEGERGSVVTELGLMRGEENPPKWGNKIREREMGKISQIVGGGTISKPKRGD